MSFSERDTPPSCYALSGAQSPFSGDPTEYTPCNHTALTENKHTSCCAPTDLCLSNGLCKNHNNPDPTAPPFNEYWRMGCTDPTYNDPACPKQCDDVGGKTPREVRLIFQCPGTGKWCCGTGTPKEYPRRGVVNTTCCDDVALMIREDEQALVYTTAAKVNLETSSSSTATQTATTSEASSSASQPSTVTVEPSATTSSSSPRTTSNSPKTSSNAIAYGVGFGVGIPLLACFLFALYFLLRRRRRQTDRYNGPPTELDGQTYKLASQAHVAEPGGRGLPRELEVKPVELEAPREPVEAWTPGNIVQTRATNEKSSGGRVDGDAKDVQDVGDARVAGVRPVAKWEQVHMSGLRSST